MNLRNLLLSIPSCIQLHVCTYLQERLQFMSAASFYNNFEYITIVGPILSHGPPNK